MPNIPIQSACICNQFNIVKASQTSKRNAYHLVCSCWYSVPSYIILDVAEHMLLRKLIVIARRNRLRKLPSFMTTQNAGWTRTITIETSHCSNLQSNVATHEHLLAEITIVRRCAKAILKMLLVWKGTIVWNRNSDTETSFTRALSAGLRHRLYTNTRLTTKTIEYRLQSSENLMQCVSKKTKEK